MKRKLIKQGKGALTVSLPKKWIDFNKLDSSDEVNIIDIDNTILISCDSSEKINETNIELKQQTIGEYRSILGALYRGGYSLIKVKFDDSKIIPNLQKAIDSLYGFEIFDITEESCVIKSIYNSESTDIISHIKRIVYTIKMIQKIIYEDVLKSKIESKEQILEFRNNILRQRDLIMRIIKEGKLLDNKHFPYYSIVISLWQVTRFYFHMYQNINSKDNFNKKDLDLLKEVEKYFSRSFDKITSLKINEYTKRNKNYQIIREESLEDLKNNQNNPIISSFCLNIIYSIQFADSSIYLLNHED